MQEPCLLAQSKVDPLFCGVEEALQLACHDKELSISRRSQVMT